MNQRRLVRIWVGIFAGFTILAALYALQTGAQSAQDGRSEAWVILFRRQLVLWWMRALFAPLAVGFSMWSKHADAVWTLPIHAAGAMLFAACAGLATGILDFAVHWAPSSLTLRQVVLTNVVVTLATGVLAYLLVVAGHLTLQAARETRASELESAELRGELAESQLHVLRMQLHPHFLFNALNSVSALMGEDVRRSRVALSRLSDLLRKSIDQVSEHQISLGEELELVDAYLDIQRMRFGDRLDIRTTVAEAALDGMVPSFLLQPVLENAVKFGVERRSGPGRIELSAERRSDRLHIEVRDNGIPVELQEQESRFGIGLRNSRARLAHLYGDAYMLDLIPNEIGGTTVLIEVPWTTAPAPLREAGAPA